jgi:phenylalanyl-tRNA synthetase beta chain
MPKIEISKRELEKLIGKEFSISELDNLLLFAKGELENVEGDAIKVDIKDTNRPDLWSVEGIAREIKLHLGIKTEVTYKDSKVEVVVDEKTNRVRPYIACCIVKGLNFTDDLIKEIMEQQEKLHLLLGRDREKIAIGISNFDLITPNITYKLATENIRFIPLGYEGEMTPKEILKKHEKGIKYRHLVEEEIPILVDSKAEVISMPPIINSDKLGKITEETKNVFIDVTGTDEKLVELTLLVLALNFVERGGKIERVKIKYKNRSVIYPILDKKSVKINPNNIRNLLGLNLSDKGIIDLLKKAGYECSMKRDKIDCVYPPYRYDIIDERDVIEDVVISYGYNDIEPLNLEIFTIGEENKKEKYCKDVEELMIGLGFQQVLSFILSNEENEIKKMKTKTELCKIANPCSQNYTVVRTSLLPPLLNFLSKNQHNEFPQKIFEVGKTIRNTKEKILLSTMISNSIVGYEEISSVLDALLSNLKISYKFKITSDPRFIEGRVAKIFINNKEVGIIGEISPEILENFKLEHPVVVFELDLEFLFK